MRYLVRRVPREGVIGKIHIDFIQKAVDTFLCPIGVNISLLRSSPVLLQVEIQLYLQILLPSIPPPLIHPQSNYNG